MSSVLTCNGIGYSWLYGTALDLASTYQMENPQGFSEVGENKQLLIAIVVTSNYLFVNESILALISTISSGIQSKDLSNS